MGVYGDLITIHPKPYSIYLRGVSGPGLIGVPIICLELHVAVNLNPETLCPPKWGLPEIMDTFLGLAIFGIIVFWGLY